MSSSQHELNRNRFENSLSLKENVNKWMTFSILYKSILVLLLWLLKRRQVMRNKILKFDLLSAAWIKPHRGQSNAVAIKHSLSLKPNNLLYFYLLTLNLAKINKLGYSGTNLLLLIVHNSLKDRLLN